MPITEFLPVTLQEWLGVATLLGAAIGAVWLFAWRPIMKEVALQALQIKGHEQEIARVEGRTDALEMAANRTQLDYSNLRESVTRLSVEVQTLVRLTQDSAVSRVEELGEIRERLVRIETKVDQHRGDQ